MNSRVKKYNICSVDMNGARFELQEEFSDAQARSIGAAIDADGISINKAIELMKKWNTESRLQGVDRVYSIPFVKHSVTA